MADVNYDDLIPKAPARANQGAPVGFKQPAAVSYDDLIPQAKAVSYDDLIPQAKKSNEPPPLNIARGVPAMVQGPPIPPQGTAPQPAAPPRMSGSAPSGPQAPPQPTQPSADPNKFARSTLLDAPRAIGAGALAAVQDIPASIGEAFQGAQGLAQRGVQQTAEGVGQGKATKVLRGAAKVFAGSAGELFSPLSGITEALIGKPAANISGSRAIGDRAADVASLAPLERLLPKGAGSLQPAAGRIEPGFTPDARAAGQNAVERVANRTLASTAGYDAVRKSVNQDLLRDHVAPGIEKAITPTSPARAIEPSAQSPGPYEGHGDSFGMRDARRADDPNVPEWFGQTQTTLNDLADHFGIMRPDVYVTKDAGGSPLGVANTKGHILLDDGLNPKRAIAVAMHEFGHHLDFQLFDKQPMDVQRAINDAYNKYLSSVKQNPKASSKIFHAPISNEGSLGPANKDYIEYITNRREWFAEQASRWLSQTAEPRTVVDKFFKTVADAWREIYKRLTGNYTPLDKDVDAFLRGHWREPSGQFSSFGDFDRSLKDQEPPKPTPNPTIPHNADDAIAGAYDDLIPKQPKEAQAAPPVTITRGPRPGAGGAAPTPVHELLKSLNALNPPVKPKQALTLVPKAMRALFNPANIDTFSRGAAADIRAARGTAERQSAIAAAAMEGFRKTANSWDDETRLEFLSYVEGRSQQPPFTDPHVQGFADTIRDVLQSRRTDMENLTNGNQRSFIDDYFPHLWRDQKAAKAFTRQWTGGGPEGSTGFTKARTYPTIEDGIRAGLIPASTDPIENVIRYVENADRYVATERVFDEARRLKTVKYYSRGKQPEGWKQVDGRKASIRGKTAYAPEGWAEIYNNHVSQGFQGPGGDLYRAVQQASNTIAGFELGLSGYHAFTTMKQGILSGMTTAVDNAAAAIGNAGKGRFGQAGEQGGRAAAQFVKAFGSPVTMYLTGKKVRDAYLGHGPGTLDYSRIANLLEKAGGRATGKGRVADEYRFADQASYWKAFRGGSLGRELRDSYRNIVAHPVSGTAQEVVRFVQRVMETASAGLFEKYIPMMKNGAFYEGMQTWLKNHPAAGAGEQLDAARKIWDNVDDRMGEMVQDNLFWKKTLRQAAQLSMLSYSYNAGTMRQIAGSARDIARVGSEGWTNRASYAVALPLTLAPIAAAYQFAKTGKGPESLLDLVAPQTGGTDRYGKKERLLVPGDVKEFFGIWDNGPAKQVLNKLAPLLRTAGELMTNKDWRDHPIAKDDAGVGETVKAYLSHVAAVALPFSFENAARGGEKGSRISAPERFMGFRSAPFGIQDSDVAAKQAKARGMRERAEDKRDEVKQKARYGQ